MVKVDDLKGMWINPYDVDHYDPMNFNNPSNAMHYIAEQIHRLELCMNNDSLGEISDEQVLECIDNLAKLAEVARQKSGPTR